MALTMSGRRTEAQAMLTSMRDFVSVNAEKDVTIATTYRDVGIPVAEAILAHGSKDYAKVIEIMMPTRYRMLPLGGSWAQRDVWERMLIHAAINDQQHSLARALLAERTNMAPTSAPSADDRRILHEVFGFDDYREGQEPVVRALLAGRNALAVMPTGSGKSLCFQVSALALGGLTIVVSPLVALMQDQVAALRLAGVPAETINSARDRADNVAAWRRVAAGEIHLLYLSPERLMTERMLAALTK